MKLLDTILFFLSAPKCAYCGEGLSFGDLALCKKCKASYESHKIRNCSRCNKMLYNCDCTIKFLDAHFIHNHIKVYRYKPGENTPANILIYKLKREKRKDIVKFLANELANSISYSLKINENTIITSVPRRKSEKAKYGMDHATMLAKEVANILSVKYISFLKSKAKSAQKKAGGKVERIKNAKFKLKNRNIDLSGKTVIIVDDIVTTGASLAAAAFNIKTLTPKKIFGASIAIAYRDDYTPLSTNDRFNKRRTT